MPTMSAVPAGDSLTAVPFWVVIMPELFLQNMPSGTNHRSVFIVFVTSDVSEICGVGFFGFFVLSVAGRRIVFLGIVSVSIGCVL